MSEINRKGSPQDLPQAASVAGWPTARASDGRGGADMSRSARGAGGADMATTAKLAGWSTASARDWKDTGGMSMTGVNPDGTVRSRADQLGRQVHLAGPMRLTASGQMLIGSTAGMTSGGQLNPDHSRWLMGFPAVWGSCGATAMQSIRNKRRSSSKKARKPSPKPGPFG